VYRYALTAYDQVGQTGKSNIVQARTKSRPPLPTNLTADSGLVKAVKLNWSAIDDPDIGGYLVYRGLSPDTLAPIAKVKGYQKTAYLDKGKFLPSLGALLKKGQLFSSLQDGQTYYYAIAGFNLFDGEGDRTSTVTAITKPRPDPIAALTATVKQRQILIRWHKSPAPDIAFYQILRSKDGRSWSELEKVDAGQNTYQDADLKPEAEYRYQIIAEDQDGLTSDPVESNSIVSPIPKSNG
jgi:fibronectin type 3 domain-containing protein